MTIDRIIEFLQIEQECVKRNVNNECDRDCFNCDIVQPDEDLTEMYKEAINILQKIKRNEEIK